MNMITGSVMAENVFSKVLQTDKKNSLSLSIIIILIKNSFFLKNLIQMQQQIEMFTLYIIFITHINIIAISRYFCRYY